MLASKSSIYKIPEIALIIYGNFEKLRQQNVRVTEINKVDMRTSFRPGDIVKASGISFFDVVRIFVYFLYDDNKTFKSSNVVETNVGNWFAGRVAETWVADHRTKHVMLNQDYQYADEASGMGQLVVPVYFNHSGARLKFVGIIEFVTTQPK
ncbi:PB1 domain-containing protein, partial [Tanacetum coccineum]